MAVRSPTGKGPYVAKPKLDEISKDWSMVKLEDGVEPFSTITQQEKKKAVKAEIAAEAKDEQPKDEQAKVVDQV